MQRLFELEHKLNALLPQSRRDAYDRQLQLQTIREWSKAVWEEAVRLGPVGVSAKDVSAGRELIAAPVFVCGVHRSGTTLLRDLLDDHEQLSVLPSEGTYITNLEPKLKRARAKAERQEIIVREWLQRMAKHLNQPPYWLLGRSGEDRNPYVQFARCCMGWWDVLEQELNYKGSFLPHLAIVLAFTSCTGKIGKAIYWVDKTPTQEQYLSRLWAEFPKTKIVHIVREPVDVLASRKKMDPSPDLRKIIRDMDISFSVGLKYREQHDRFLLLRYEDLCATPETVMNQVASFLSIEPAASLLRPSAAGHPTIANSSFDKELVAGNVHLSKTHDASAMLTMPERKLLSSIVGSKAAKLGYDIERVSVPYEIFSRLRHRIF